MPTALRVLAVVGAACVLLGTASAFESREPQAPNYYDTIGVVNFQGGHSCKTRPTVGSTQNEEELRAAVLASESIKPVGAGMNWAMNHMSCANSGGLNVVTAGMCEKVELTAARPFYLAPFPAGSRSLITDDIRMDEVGMTVTVKSCVTVQALLEYLATHRGPDFPSGYGFESPSTFYVGMTVGGAIAGASHGASILDGGWPNKVLQITAMLANGEVVVVDKDTRPKLFKALKSGSSRIGIILRAKLPIIVQGDVFEEFHQFSVDGFRVEVRHTEEKIKQAFIQKAQGLPLWKEVLAEASLHNRHSVLHVRQGEGLEPKFVTTKWTHFPFGREHLYNPAEKVHAHASLNKMRWLSYLDGTHWGTDGWQVEEGEYSNYRTWEEAMNFENSYHGDHLWTGLMNNPGDPAGLWYTDQLECISISSANPRLPRLPHYLEDNHASRIEQPLEPYTTWTTMAKGHNAGGRGCYNWTEYGVPYWRADLCLERLFHVMREMVDEKAGVHDFKYSIRFSGIDEDNFISPNANFPRMWVGFASTTKEETVPLHNTLRGGACQSVENWGAEGWYHETVGNPLGPHRNSTVEQIGPNWCNFGCLAETLDPSGKFVGGPAGKEVWTFAAYDFAAKRIVNGKTFVSNCCSGGGPGEDDASFDESRCMCAANMVEDSVEAEMACYVMHNEDLFHHFCDQVKRKKPDSEDETPVYESWALMSGCDWEGIRVHWDRNHNEPRYKDKGCATAQPPPSPPPPQPKPPPGGAAGR